VVEEEVSEKDDEDDESKEDELNKGGFNDRVRRCVLPCDCERGLVCLSGLQALRQIGQCQFVARLRACKRQ
jgi:hypothetical protein